jgi:enoyl-CoA hydratase
LAETSASDLATDMPYEVRGAVARVMFNRPASRNSFTFAMQERLTEICEEIDADRSIRALILTGAGGGAFASGTDITQFKVFDRPEDAIAYEERANRMIGALEQCRVPIIAAISGIAAGGGLGIAACCDIRVGTKDVRFSLPIARTLGNCLSLDNYARFSAAVGANRLRDLIFTARSMGAEEAHRIGFLNEVVEDHGAAIARADEIAALICSHAPLTLEVTKKALRRIRADPDRTGEEELILTCYMSDDFKEGMSAFLSKRKPQWTGH